MKIYTKTGDDGTSSIYSGLRFSKSELIFEVLGSLDELNACLGLVGQLNIKKVSDDLVLIQNDLFSLGSIVAGKEFGQTQLRKLNKRVMQMEKCLDSYDKKNKPLTNFILPGGCIEASYLHVARAVCRRTERRVVELINRTANQSLTPVQKYLNRLSDFLFVLSRFVNKERSVAERVWDNKFF